MRQYFLMECHFINVLCFFKPSGLSPLEKKGTIAMVYKLVWTALHFLKKDGGAIISNNFL